MRTLDLGDVEVELDADQPREPGARVVPRGTRQAALLTLLVARVNTRVSADALIEFAWGEERVGGDQGAVGDRQGALDSQLWRLRQLLEPGRGRGAAPTRIVTDAGGYRLVSADDQVDSHRFATRIATARTALTEGRPADSAAAAREALALWRGRPFGRFADEPVLAADVARLEELRLQAYEVLIEALLPDDPRAAADVAETMVATAPLRESGWRHLILARQLTGRTADALEAYQRAFRLLRDELGVEPSAALRALHQQILDGTVAEPERQPAPSAASGLKLTAGSPQPAGTPEPAGPPQPAGPTRPEKTAPEVRLPSWLTSLVARESEVARIAGLLARPGLVTVVGPAGCGKTRLAVAAAAAAAAEFPDGIWFVDLAPITPADEAQQTALVVSATINTIGISTAQSRGPLDVLADFTRTRRLLLVLDNCEHLLAGCAEMVEAVVGLDAGCTLLATSRTPLDVDGETVWSLAPLSLLPVPDPETPDPESSAPEPWAPAPLAPAPLAPEPLAPEPAAPEPLTRGLSAAARLFADRAHRARPEEELDLSGPDAELVEAICAAADGLPLAIELAAARVRFSSLAEIAQQLRADPGAVTRVGRSRRSGPVSVRAAIESSHRLLSPSERVLHRRLAVLPGRFGASLAVTVAGFDPLAPDEVVPLLAELVHSSMIELDAGSSERSRYRQLVTIRAHARRALDAAGETELLLDRRDGWLSELVADAPPLDRPGHEWLYRELDDEADTIRAVLHRCLVAAPSRRGARLTVQLDGYWLRRVPPADTARWLEAAIAVPEADPDDTMINWLALGTQWLRTGQYDRIRSDLDLVLARGRSIPPEITDSVLRLLTLLVINTSYADVPDLVGPMVDRALEIGAGTTGRAARLIIAAIASYGRAFHGATDVGPWAEAVAAEAVAAGEGFAAALAISTLIRLSYATGDMRAAAGWVDQQQLIMFAGPADRPAGTMLEARAGMMIFAGEPAIGVAQAAASRALAHRLGVSWPEHAITDRALERARAELGVAGYEDAWALGVQLDVAQATSLDPRAYERPSSR